MVENQKLMIGGGTQCATRQAADHGGRIAVLCQTGTIAGAHPLDGVERNAKIITVEVTAAAVQSDPTTRSAAMPAQRTA